MTSRNWFPWRWLSRRFGAAVLAGTLLTMPTPAFALRQTNVRHNSGLEEEVRRALDPRLAGGFEEPTPMPPRITLQGHSGKVSVLAITPDGRTLISGSEIGSVQRWNLTTGQPDIIAQSAYQIHALAMAFDGRMLAWDHYAALLTDRNPTIQLWDLQAARPGPVLRGHVGKINALVFAPDSRTLVSGGYDDGTIRVWDLTANPPSAPRVFTGHTGRIWALAVTPDSRTLVSGSADGTVRRWDLATGQSAILSQGNIYAHAIRILPDGRTIFSANDSGITQWDLRVGPQSTTPLKGQTKSIMALAFTPDGGTLVSGGGGEVVQLWNVNAGRAHSASPRRASGWIRALAISRDGHTMAAAGDRKAIWVWDLLPKDKFGIEVEERPEELPPLPTTVYPAGVRHNFPELRMSAGFTKRFERIITPPVTLVYPTADDRPAVLTMKDAAITGHRPHGIFPDDLMLNQRPEGRELFGTEIQVTAADTALDLVLQRALSAWRGAPVGRITTIEHDTYGNLAFLVEVPSSPAGGLEEDESGKPSRSSGSGMSRRGFLARGATAVAGAAAPSAPAPPADLSVVSNAAAQARDGWQAATRELTRAVAALEPAMSNDPLIAAAGLVKGLLESRRSPALLAEDWGLPRVAARTAALQPHHQQLTDSPALQRLARETVEAEQAFRTISTRWVALQQQFIEVAQRTQPQDAGWLAANVDEMSTIVDAATDSPTQMTLRLLKAFARHRLMQEGLLPPDQPLAEPPTVGPLNTQEQQTAFLDALMRPRIQGAIDRARVEQDAAFGDVVPSAGREYLAPDGVTAQIVDAVPLPRAGGDGSAYNAATLDRRDIFNTLKEFRWTALWNAWGDRQRAELAARGITGSQAERILTEATTAGLRGAAKAGQAYEHGLREYLSGALDRQGARFDLPMRKAIEDRLARMTPLEIEQQILPDMKRWMTGQRQFELARRPADASSGSPRASRAPQEMAATPDAIMPTWSPEAMAPLKAAWARWPNQESGARLVPWAEDAEPHPSVLTLYAPEPWWDTLQAALPVGAVAFASPEALVAGAPGLLLLDAVADTSALPADRPVALRLQQPTDLWRPDDPTRPTLDPATLLQRLWDLAAQPTLRGEVYLWVPESAQPVEWDQRSVLVLAVEA